MERFPSIVAILEEFRAPGSHTVRRKDSGSRSWFTMAVAGVKHVPADLPDKLLAQLKTTQVSALQELWTNEGIVVAADDGVEQAPLKIVFQQLRQFWDSWCVVAYNRQTRNCGCTCWMHMHRGHCPHLYAVQELLELKRWVRPELPSAREGALALRAGVRPTYQRESVSPVRRTRSRSRVR